MVGGAVLGTGFRWSPWKGKGQTAGHSSSPLEEVTASLRHEAEHPLATSSQPQPGLSWAGGTSPVPMVAAVSTDHILVSPSPLWGAPWQMCGHMAGTTGLGVVGGTLCARVSAPHSLFQRSCRTVGSKMCSQPFRSHVWAGHGAWSIRCSVCSWHSLTPYHDLS